MLAQISRLPLWSFEWRLLTRVIVEIADTLYWVMFECSFALLAACLPTLRAFLAKFYPEALIQSIRSVISLHSLRSDRSEHAQNPRLYEARLLDQEGCSSTQQMQLRTWGLIRSISDPDLLNDLEAQEGAESKVKRSTVAEKSFE